MRTKLMTIGQLARRTGASIKALREYERLGWLYTRGRSEGNYRLFDESALWCVQVIASLRGLGLTLNEIDDLIRRYGEHPGAPLGPLLGERLDRVLGRIEARMAELEALRQRIQDFRAAHAVALAGQAELPLLRADPHRAPADSTP